MSTPLFPEDARAFSGTPLAERMRPRSLDELAGTPEFEDIVNRELPRFASVWPEGMSRRGFLQLTSASLALAGLTGCTKQPLEKIIPYVKQPEQLIPGKPLFFATAMSLGGYARGVLAESHMGRPTKIEGNPEHPYVLGGTVLPPAGRAYLSRPNLPGVIHAGDVVVRAFDDIGWP